MRFVHRMLFASRRGIHEIPAARSLTIILLLFYRYIDLFAMFYGLIELLMDKSKTISAGNWKIENKLWFSVVLLRFWFFFEWKKDIAFHK